MTEYEREWTILIDRNTHKFTKLSVRVCSVCRALVEEDQMRDHLIWHAEMEARYGK